MKIITTDAWRALPGQIGYLIRIRDGGEGSSYALYRNPPLDPDAGFRIARGAARRWSPCNTVVGCVRIEAVSREGSKIEVSYSPVPEEQQPWVTRPELGGLERELAFAVR